MLRSPHLAEGVSLAVWIAIRTCFSLTADGTLTKTRHTDYFSDANTAKIRKAKEKEETFSRKLRLIMKHYD